MAIIGPVGAGKTSLLYSLLGEMSYENNVISNNDVDEDIINIPPPPY